MPEMPTGWATTENHYYVNSNWVLGWSAHPEGH